MDGDTLDGSLWIDYGYKEMIKEFELDNDGYPTDNTLITIEEWTHKDGFNNLLENITPLLEGYGKCVRDSNNWVVVTGGWSGNESIINSLLKNRMFWMLCWRLSKVGGYYGFRVR